MKIHPKDYDKYLSEEADEVFEEIEEKEKEDKLIVKEKRADRNVYGKSDAKRKFKHG